MLPSIKQVYALGQAILKVESVAYSQPNLLSPNGLKLINKDKHVITLSINIQEYTMKVYTLAAIMFLSGCAHLQTTDTSSSELKNTERQNIGSRGTYSQNISVDDLATQSTDSKQVCKRIKRNKHFITRCQPVGAR